MNRWSNIWTVRHPLQRHRAVVTQFLIRQESSMSLSSSASPPSSAERRAWMAVFARTPRADLEAALQRALGDVAAPEFDWLRPPETGLAMVRGRVGGSGDPFNLGEATVTRATLRLRSPAEQAPG